MLPARIRDLPVKHGVTDQYTLEAPGCQILFVQARQGATLPTHTHDTDNVSVVLTGGVIITTDEKTHRYGPGEWCETFAGQPHAVHFDVDTVQVELRFEVAKNVH
jgi:quercetin dioxygenase-like cupin family protein